MSRKKRRAISATTPQPLAIIAGLPNPNHSAVKAAIEAIFPKWKVISTPFPRGVGKTYTDRGAMLNLVREVCSFAEQQADLAPPRPGQLVLIYVKDDGFQQLLDVFGFSTFAMPIDVGDWHWPDNQHWKGKPEIVTDLVQRSISYFETEEGGKLKTRLERADYQDILMLPPRNFLLPDGSKLIEQFNQHHPDASIIEIDHIEVPSETFTVEELPTFFKKTGEISKQYRIDNRGLVFAISRHGQHGSARMQDVASSESLKDFRPLLEGLYRFGTPLRSGFQHDAQWKFDKLLADEEFLDINKPIRLSQSHANIYGNDRVR